MTHVLEVQIGGEVTPAQLAEAARLLARTLRKKPTDKTWHHVGVGDGIVTFKLWAAQSVAQPQPQEEA